MPILDQLVLEQKEQDVNWTPSKIINRLGKEINNEEVSFDDSKPPTESFY